MTDGQSLLLIFVALYLIESLRWLPVRSYVLIGSGRSWRARRPFQAVELGGASPALLGALPPMQDHWVTLPWQFIPAESGLEVHSDDRRPRRVSWEELQPRVEGKRLDLAPGCALRWVSEKQAQELQQRLLAWKQQSQAEREADFLKLAEESLQQGPLEDDMARLSPQTKWLKRLGSTIFVWTFMVMVVLYRWLGDGLEILCAAAVLLSLQLSQAILFARKARTVPHRIWKALAIALLPQHAMRAADLLADAHLVAPMPLHPLAARTLIDDQAWRKLATHFWKRARYSPSMTADLQCRALESFFQAQGVTTRELENIPKQEAGTVAYCPNCSAQFQAGPTQCLDCGGVELRSF